MSVIIRTEGVSKRYREFMAVEDVSLTITKGEIYGFIGLNGAGKTTTIRMLLGMIRPTAGACYIGGEKVGLKSHRIWERVGYMVETPHAYPDLTVRENIDSFRQLRMVKDTGATSRVMEKLQLTRYADKKAKQLSLGNAQRLGIAKALLHNPDILILDEPVNGLDPAGIVEIRELLQDLALNQGITVFLSSHLLDEISRIATTIGIIHEGKLLQEIGAERLKGQFIRRLLLGVRNPESAAGVLNDAGYVVTLTKEKSVEISGSKAIQYPEKIATLLVERGIPPVQLVVEEENLETYFLRITGQNGGTRG